LTVERRKFNGTQCEMVIMTCWSFTFGQRLAN